MSAALAFRSFVAASVLVSACSQSPGTPLSSSSDDAGATTQAGSSAHASAMSGASAGGRGSDAPAADVPAAGSTDRGTAGANSNSSAAGSAGAQFGGSTATPVTWKVLAETQDSNVYVTVPSSASRGKDAAVAYVESTTLSSTETQTRVVMQRFDAHGERLGSPIELANDADQRSNVSLASDGERYGACWNTATEIHCSLIDGEGRAQPDTLSITGQYATIVAGASGWAVAYMGSDKRVRLQPLSATLELDGTYIGPQIFALPSSRADGPLFAATPSGYALVGSNDEDGNVSLLRLSPDLQSVVDSSPLGRSLWLSGQVIATDTRAAVSLAAPYGSFLLLLDAKNVTAELPISGGGKAGMDSALLLTDGGIGAAWLDRGAGVRRRFFPDGHDADIGLANRAANASLLGGQEEGSESYQQLLQVADQTLLVARSRRYGLFPGSAIRVAALTFP